jgi:cytochrome c biogenesis protein CcdA
VFATAVLVASIAFADSLNPSTILPALYLATTEQAARKLAAFAAGVFAVSFLFGVVIVAGPGELILDAVPHIGKTTKHIVEACVGGVLIAIAAGLLYKRDTIVERLPTGSTSRSRRGSFALGAGIMLVELPTALPYFAAIAAIVGSGSNLGAQLGYVALFNFVFVLPVLAILWLRMLAHQRGAEDRIEAARDWVRRYANSAVVAVAGVAGAAFLAVGIVGLA